MFGTSELNLLEKSLDCQCLDLLQTLGGAVAGGAVAASIRTSAAVAASVIEAPSAAEAQSTR